MKEESKDHRWTGGSGANIVEGLEGASELALSRSVTPQHNTKEDTQHTTTETLMILPNAAKDLHPSMLLL